MLKLAKIYPILLSMNMLVKKLATTGLDVEALSPLKEDKMD